MISRDPSPLRPLLYKLGAAASLTEQEQQAVAALPFALRSLPADVDVVHEGDRPVDCCLLVTGFACRYKWLEGDRRQIFSFHVPGDILDLATLHLPVMDHTVTTLVPSTAAFIAHASLRALMQRHPRIGAALVRDSLIDGAVFRERMVGMGRRPAHARVAHLVCEQVRRMQSVEQADGNTVQLPITPAHIADSLGLSVVHASRIVWQLQDEGLITWKDGILTVEDWVRLQRAGEFDPAYLHLTANKAA